MNRFFTSFQWQQNPLSAERLKELGGIECRWISVRTKILLLLALALFLFGAVSVAISYGIYMESSIDQHRRLGMGTAKLVANTIDPSRVDEYMEKGALAEGYTEIERRLYHIRETSPEIQYVYVYKIMEDGCHVVFDLDNEEGKGGEPGEVIPFDNAFKEYVPTLLAGGNIKPIISDETYGWLLTSYIPVYDEKGVCRCYAAVDISMNDLRENAGQFLLKLCIIFLALFILILSAAFWLAKYNLILPINSMAHCARVFSRNSQENLEQSLKKIKELGIHTGDEVENLYDSLVTMTKSSVSYIEDIRKKNETISELQNVLILTLADMVENRDKNTGEHIRKTAAYVEIIAEELRRKGVYSDELTDRFIKNLVASAPLHDVGKIGVPDAILNKPGKLTQEEFEVIKSHTTIGGKIISSLITAVPNSEYLHDAMDLALYHHEKWNGRGYPSGLSEENIPLSARIMAVADVFDALVSNRSYKKGFSYEKAFSIIQEESGTQFDPKIVEAFFSVKEEVLRIADEFSEKMKKGIPET